jgi:hypothetical protein
MKRSGSGNFLAIRICINLSQPDPSARQKKILNLDIYNFVTFSGLFPKRQKSGTLLPKMNQRYEALDLGKPFAIDRKKTLKGNFLRISVSICQMLVQPSCFLPIGLDEVLMVLCSYT